MQGVKSILKLIAQPYFAVNLVKSLIYRKFNGKKKKTHFPETGCR